MQCHSDEEKSGEHSRKRCNPGRRDTEAESERARGAILTHRKDDDTVEGILVFGKAFSFAGGAGTRALATSTSQPPLALKRSGGGRRGGRDSKSFAAAMVVTKNARRGIEEGSSRNAGALHSSPSASKGFGRPSQGGISGVSLAGSRRRTLSAESFWLAADARLFGDGHAANARERQAPRGARRSDAGEDIGARWVCPYVESSLQKSVGGNGLKKRSFPTFCLTARE